MLGRPAASAARSEPFPQPISSKTLCGNDAFDGKSKSMSPILKVETCDFSEARRALRIVGGSRAIRKLTATRAFTGLLPHCRRLIHKSVATDFVHSP